MENKGHESGVLNGLNDVEADVQEKVSGDFKVCFNNGRDVNINIHINREEGKGGKGKKAESEN